MSKIKRPVIHLLLDENTSEEDEQAFYDTYLEVLAMSKNITKEELIERMNKNNDLSP